LPLHPVMAGVELTQRVIVVGQGGETGNRPAGRSHREVLQGPTHIAAR